MAYVRAHETESNAMLKKTAVADEYHTDIIKGTPLTSPSEHAMYKLLNEGIGQREPYQPIFLNDFAPIDRRRRYEFLEGIQKNYTYIGFGNVEIFGDHKRTSKGCASVSFPIS